MPLIKTSPRKTAETPIPICNKKDVAKAVSIADNTEVPQLITPVIASPTASKKALIMSPLSLD